VNLECLVPVLSKSGRIRLAGHVSGIGKTTTEYIISAGKHQLLLVYNVM
jgi:hypothetical protein